MNIKYKSDRLINAAEMSNLFKASGIRRPYKDLPRLQSMIDHADIIWTAWDNEKLVGIARALTDYSYCCYLSDLCVDEEYQKMGIGKELVRLLQEQLGEEVTLVLLSAPGAMDYYPMIGFNKADNGFLIPRKQ
ncbi:GNAT family N-acetyltransferase [Jeotgalibacillus soli]|uniref:GCN5-related N-acetyltransferase n=1 Tax=Jeotgalibacillus soli TaxID=889306 RepID=A0A0C2W5S0_9BACL|nr:GNAT family N-acetyltransferase [Jeotgalibacillus soli]KIL51926.1 GCN5-related N-acetyltransferase [Jeotgalibacillus soli]